MTNVVWLNSLGLLLGISGALGLAVLTKVFITIQPDGTQHWGLPAGMTEAESRRRNIRLRKQQKFGLPASYAALALGFILQLVALWIPVVS